MTAYAYLAGRLTLTSRYVPAVTAAESALALAAELGLPEPAFALHWRGLARCGLGSANGLEDMRRALRLALEREQGREAAIIYGNLAGVVWSHEGPQAALDTLADAIAFCERRGITEVALQNRAAIPTVLAELGQTERALAEAGPLADRLHAAGDIAYIEPRALQMWLLVERGTPEEAIDPEGLAAAARNVGQPEMIADVVAAAARIRFARQRPEQALALLRELDELTTHRYALTPRLPSILRTALALGDRPLAERLSSGIDPASPIDEHALVAARAQLAEAAGDHARAAELFAEVAERWREFGNVPERAYALLGQGRCLTTLTLPGAEEPLSEARELFASMGYRPALAETETLPWRKRRCRRLATDAQTNEWAVKGSNLRPWD